MKDKQVSIKYIDKHGEHCTFTCFESEMQDVVKIITTSGGTNIVAPGLYKQITSGDKIE